MIYVKNLTKIFNKLEAVKNITLKIFPGEILTILGPSGSGKTTLLRLIAGLDMPERGKVFINAKEVSSRQRKVPPNKRGLSMIFQDLALWPHMTVKDHIEFVMNGCGLKKDRFQKDAEEILTKVNLKGFANRYPHQLSGGEKQRLAIARALASNPKYLLMDEPFNNLDIVLREEIRKLIISLKKEKNIGIIYVTHNLEEIFFLSDRIAIMNNGRIELLGSKEEVLNYSSNIFVKKLLMIKQALTR